MEKARGFTLIELLIVVALLGILVVAILAAVEPVEQVKKARDAGRKSDIAELLAAYERYFTTYQCYPWDINAPLCAEENPTPRNGEHPNFSGCGGGNPGPECELFTQGEVKDQFGNRRSIKQNELFVTTDYARNVSVCFEPEARASRLGGLGQLMDAPDNQNPIPGDVCDNINYYPDGSCYVCVPQ